MFDCLVKEVNTAGGWKNEVNIMGSFECTYARRWIGAGLNPLLSGILGEIWMRMSGG